MKIIHMCISYVNNNMYNTITFQYMPTSEQLLFTLEHHSILSTGNMLGLTANIGAGKSQICELFASYWINPEIAKYTIQCHHNNGKCLYVDTERTENDCFKGLLRIQTHTHFSQDDIMHKLIYKSGIAIEKTSDKISYLHEILQQNKDIGLLIIDGILDLVTNPNDIAESNTLGQLLVSWANTYQLGIIYTLHGNRNDVSGKGKGHIGDVFQRKSESFLQLKKKKDIRILTTNFPNGKVRNGKDTLSSTFIWNKTEICFQEINNPSQESEHSIFSLLFHTDTELHIKELTKRFIEKCHCSQRTASRRINQAIKERELFKIESILSLPTS